MIINKALCVVVCGAIVFTNLLSERGGNIMAKYGKKASEKVEEALHEMHEGTLTIGQSGKKVTNRKQAIAIGLSEAREEGGKVPKKAATKKTATKKPAVKKSTTKKTTKKSE